MGKDSLISNIHRFHEIKILNLVKVEARQDKMRTYIYIVNKIGVIFILYFV